MGEVAVLEPPEETPGEEVVADSAAEPQEVPSVVAVTNRYLIGGVDIGEAAEDGSRVLRLHSATAAVVIEANLSPQVWDFIRAKSTEVKIVTQEDEDANDPAAKG